MPCPHHDIKIIQRSNHQSAVASAAYQSGERLFSEYDQKQKYYAEKRGIVHTEIMLPPHAPPSFSDRSTLWNSVELYEKAGNAQLAREIDAALPIELSREEQIRLVREYCSSQFVSRGMCVDFAIHDTNSGNPHCHIMLTMRPLDERGAWAAKSKKEYDLDENGERIRLPSGRYKTHKWKPCSQKKHAERKRLLKERENLLRNLRRKEIRSVQRSRQKQKLEILKLWQNIKQSLKKADRTTVRDLKKCEN